MRCCANDSPLCVQRTAPLPLRGGAGGVEDRGLSRVGRAWQARGRCAQVTCSPPAHTLRRTGTPSCSLVALGSSPAHTLRRTARNPHGFVLTTPQSEQVFWFAVSRRRSVLCSALLAQRFVPWVQLSAGVFFSYWIAMQGVGRAHKRRIFYNTKGRINV